MEKKIKKRLYKSAESFIMFYIIIISYYDVMSRDNYGKEHGYPDNID